MDNIYDELDNYERVGEYEELKEENQQLHACIQELREKIDSVSKENQSLTEKLDSLERNFNSLLMTAKAEIERKTQTIETLNMEKDQLIFRHIGNRTVPPRKNKPSSEERETRGVKRRWDSPNTIENKLPRRDSPIEKKCPESDSNKQDCHKEMSTGKLKDRRKTDRIESPIRSDSEETQLIVTEETPSEHKIDKKIDKKNKMEKNRPDKKSQYEEIDEKNMRIRPTEKVIEMDHAHSNKDDFRIAHKSSDRFDDNSRKRDHSRESDNFSVESSRYSRSRYSRDSINSKKEIMPRYSKSRGRSERYFDFRPHSPSPDRRNSSSRDSRSRNRTSYSKRPYRNDSNGRWRNSPPREEYVKYSKYKTKSKSTVSSKRTDAKGSNENKKEEITNYLEHLEEEYKMHSGPIDEIQLDEETKDHYHNDSLIKQHNMQNEKIVDVVPEVEMLKNNQNYSEHFQSPDHTDIGCSSVPTHCVNIEDNGPLTPLDDPRLYSKRYFNEDNIELNKHNRLTNKYVLDEMVTLNIRCRETDIDFKIPSFQKELPKKNNDLCDEDSHRLYMDIDEDLITLQDLMTVNSQSQQKDYYGNNEVTDSKIIGDNDALIECLEETNNDGEIIKHCLPKKTTKQTTDSDQSQSNNSTVPTQERPDEVISLPTKTMERNPDSDHSEFNKTASTKFERPDELVSLSQKTLELNSDSVHSESNNLTVSVSLPKITLKLNTDSNPSESRNSTSPTQGKHDKVVSLTAKPMEQNIGSDHSESDKKILNKHERPDKAIRKNRESKSKKTLKLNTDCDQTESNNSKVSTKRRPKKAVSSPKKTLEINTDSHSESNNSALPLTQEIPNKVVLSERSLQLNTDSDHLESNNSALPTQKVPDEVISLPAKTMELNTDFDHSEPGNSTISTQFDKREKEVSLPEKNLQLKTDFDHSEYGNSTISTQFDKPEKVVSLPEKTLEINTDSDHSEIPISHSTVPVQFKEPEKVISLPKKTLDLNTACDHSESGNSTASTHLKKPNEIVSEKPVCDDSEKLHSNDNKDQDSSKKSIDFQNTPNTLNGQRLIIVRRRRVIVSKEKE